MNRVHALSLVLVFILMMATVTALSIYMQTSNDAMVPVYVGVAFGGNTAEQAKLLIDKTKGFTNLFILNVGRNGLHSNQTAINEICKYAIEQGQSLIVNLGIRTEDNWYWHLEFFKTCKDQYGDDFLGVYYDDEPMGIPFDWDWSGVFGNGSDAYRDPYLPGLDLLFQRKAIAMQTGQQPQKYSVEAQWYYDLLMMNRGHNDLQANNISTFTSDYLLYWYSFLGHYDVIFAQIGWNHSLINLQLSQIRGAATLQNKTWGTIVTWKTTEPPYLDSGENIYDQMVMSYDAGAKYIVLFNYPYNDEGNQYGILTDEHFMALEKFWSRVATKALPEAARAEAVLVLPKDYGWGLRSPEDKIWGIWDPDEKSELIWDNVEKLLGKYGLGLDIVYDDQAYPIQGYYKYVYYWNQTVT